MTVSESLCGAVEPRCKDARYE